MVGDVEAFDTSSELSSIGESDVELVGEGVGNDGGVAICGVSTGAVPSTTTGPGGW